MAQKRRFFTTFFTILFIFLGFRWNISTIEPVLERLLNFWNFGTYLTKIPHPVQSRELPKVKNFKIGVARKLDLIEPNWVCSFSSFIRLYQTHMVSPMLVLGCWTVAEWDLASKNSSKKPWKLTDVEKKNLRKFCEGKKHWNLIWSPGTIPHSSHHFPN